MFLLNGNVAYLFILIASYKLKVWKIIIIVHHYYHCYILVGSNLQL